MVQAGGKSHEHQLFTKAQEIRNKSLCVGLCTTATTLTKLYPGPNDPHWNIVDSLQVVLHVTLCHSAMKTREFNVT